MIVEIRVPSPGESISDVEIASWLVEDGEYVEKDQEIAEIDSDKATLALPAEESGVIEILVEDGETVQVGQVICKIDMDAKAPEGGATSKPKEDDLPDPGPAAKSEPVKENYATGTPSPAARKLMDEKSVKLDKGTGKDGRITKQDVLDAVASMGSAAEMTLVR